MSWHIDYAPETLVNDPLGWGFPMTPAAFMGSISAGSNIIANYAFFARTIGGGTISKIGIHVSVQSGNIDVGIYRQTTPGRNQPVTRIGSSGSVSCPAVGYAEVALTAPVTVLPGDFFAFTCDNTTATFLRTAAGGSMSNIFAGITYISGSPQFPLPATAPTLNANGDRCYLQVGVA